LNTNNTYANWPTPLIIGSIQLMTKITYAITYITTLRSYQWH